MPAPTDSLSRQAVLELDRSLLVDDITAMPDHIEDAMWRAESAMLAPARACGLVVCGMGGSAIGADLAAAALAGVIDRPIHVVRGYDLPAWVTDEDAVICSSYSGNTEETLSCFEQATRRGADVYVLSSGGAISEQAHAAGLPVIGLPGILQPRASVGYGVTGVIEVGIATGIVGNAVRGELNAAASLLRSLAAEWGPDASPDSFAKRLARAAHDRLSIIYGAELTAPIAYRWKTQINENAKLPAISAELPEADHNEICGWHAADVAPKVAWFLRDAGQHERVRARIDLTAEIATAAGAAVEVIDTPGETPMERLFGAVLLGDLVSLYMGVLRGEDPSPVPIIEDLKDRLGRPTRA